MALVDNRRRGAVCWIGPLGQQIFGAHPNGTALLHSLGFGSGKPVKALSSVLGLHALARAASPKAVWATPRPTQPFASYNDVLHNGNFVYLLAFVALVVVVVLAWQRKNTYLLSMSTVTIASAIGLVALYARIPANYTLSFQWISLAVWIVGICIWLTIGSAIVTWVPNYLSIGSQIRVSKRALKISVLALMAIATIAGTIVVMFPYGKNGQRLDFTAMRRVQEEAQIVEKAVPKGDVGITVRYSGADFLQTVEDEHGTAYLLRTAGWVPGLPQGSDGLLHSPIHSDKPFVVFYDHQTSLTGFRIYDRYSPFEALAPPHPRKLSNLRNLIKHLKRCLC